MAINANFSSYSNYITDSLHQWDRNQILTIRGLNLPSAPEVHFHNKSMDRALVRQATMENHVIAVNVPNTLLQAPLRIYANIGIYAGSTFKVVETVEIPVIPCPRPQDYVFEDTDGEVYSFNRLENMIENRATKAQVANIVAGVSTDSELVDVRYGADGVTYPSAGEAVREQFNNMRRDISGVSGGVVELSPVKNQTYVASDNVIETIIFADYSKRQRLRVKYVGGTAVIGESSIAYLGVTDADTGAETAPLVTLKVGVESEIVLPFNASKFRLYILEVQSDGSVEFTIESVGMLEEVEALSGKINSLPKTIGIIGDSYSTYKDWIDENYNPWYADGGNAQTNDISDVTETWWYKLCVETNRTLLRNCSYSGSTICNTGENGADVSASSFVGRVANDFGVKRTLEVKPDEIFIFGGTNDTWVNAPVGSVKYSNWVANDLKSVLPAFCYLLDYVRKYNPGAKIYNVVNDLLSNSIKDGMRTACEYYGVVNIELTDISKTNGHPNTAGMESIKTQIVDVI